MKDRHIRRQAKLLTLLSHPRVGARGIRDHWRKYGQEVSVELLWEEACHLPVQLSIAGGGFDLRQIYREAEEEIRACVKMGIKMVSLFDAFYPVSLREIYDPPPVLFYKGDLLERMGGNRPQDCKGAPLERTATTRLARTARAIAIVGSRNSTTYGRKVAENLARQLTAVSICVGSGLAEGLDTWDHRGATARKGGPIAVFGKGLDIYYPRRNRSLQEELCHKGTVLSEYRLRTLPLRHNFPARNRIISGLANGVVVVEASESSGALITADFALAEGKSVFAIPGNIYHRNTRGTHALLKDGARLVERVEDILEELYPDLLSQKGRTISNGLFSEMEILASLSEEERLLYLQLDQEPQHIDDLSRMVDMEVNKALGILLQLEIKGLIIQEPAMNFVRA
ncbi:DNA-processing protein DprA [Candidatus Hakubella thermalkaliphila]|uniref:DNA processing protein n=1 Tax=Candidatus Hakubella thermalkaliphila TaxID=2754717 RepID=A0A6V8Q304_9ACTN|nr:DNA-processing protein DprA [Candidatus Hakubella thermalkaliphila]GFP38820.1 DNA processing protein [Candidatus Hakubella thermalkaliphila]